MKKGEGREREGGRRELIRIDEREEGARVKDWR